MRSFECFRAVVRPRTTSPRLPKLLGVAAAMLWGSLTIGPAALQADQLDGRPWWPHFHGPRRDNVSRETGLMTQWPQRGPKLLWKFPNCGQGFSGVSLAEGKIFTAGDFDDVEKVLALDLDGQMLWQSPNGASWTGPYPGSRTTPSYSDGVLYQMNPQGRVAAYRADSGKQLWAVDLVEKFAARYGTWSMTENLAVEGDLLFCVPGGSKALVVALNKNTGQTAWTNTALNETAAYCSPILVTHQGVRQLITLTQKSLIGLDVQSGRLLWSHPHVTPNDQNVNAPLFQDGYVFVASGHSAGARLLKLRPDGQGVEQLWWDKTLDNCHGSVMLLDGGLYGSACRSGGKGFFCADFLTGKLRYREGKMEKLSLTAADGLIYGLTQDGQVLLIRPRPDRLEIVSRFQTPPDSRELSWAHPVVCGGRLYLRRGEQLYAYDLRRK